MGICQPLQKEGVNFMGGEAASPTNPEKGRDNKRNTNMQTVLRRVDWWKKNAQVHGPG